MVLQVGDTWHNLRKPLNAISEAKTLEYLQEAQNAELLNAQSTFATIIGTNKINIPLYTKLYSTLV